MNLCKVCGKETMPPYTECFSCYSTKKLNNPKVLSKTPLSQTVEVLKTSALGSDHADRILRSQCLNIASEQLMGNVSKEKLLQTAKEIYNYIKKDGWL